MSQRSVWASVCLVGVQTSSPMNALQSQQETGILRLYGRLHGEGSAATVASWLETVSDRANLLP